MRAAILLVSSITLAACSGETESPTAPAEDSSAEGRLWVTSQYLDRHTCPDENCGIVGRLFFREGVDTLEEREGWVRITRDYDASCSGGKSAYVDRGNDRCEAANGIDEGRFAEWVKAENLSAARPADPAGTATGAEALVAQSDDFAQHREAFVTAANELISSGRCSEADFVEQGGWVKSSNHRDLPVYFTYCGGMTTGNRIYLDVTDGRIYR